MERKDFLSLIGIGSASMLAAVCLGSCSKSSAGGNAPSNVDFNIDLSLPANAALVTAGGYIYSSGIIVAKTTAGSYIAVSQSCTHQGVSVQYQGDVQRFYCPGHGASFSNTGAVLGGPAGSALKQYNVALTGTILRVYS